MSKRLTKGDILNFKQHVGKYSFKQTMEDFYLPDSFTKEDIQSKFSIPLKVDAQYSADWVKPTKKPTPKYSLEQIFSLTRTVGRKYDLVTHVADFARAVPPGYAPFEVLCHEIVHGLLINPSNIESSEVIGRRIKEMPGWLANEHELATLRIEAIVLNEYVEMVDVAWIYGRANWRPPGKHPMNNPYVWRADERDKPGLDKLNAPLTLAECAVAKHVHTILKEYL